VEYKPTPVWTIRAFGGRRPDRGYRDRDVYAGLRGSAPLRLVEHRKLNNGALMA
jgi:hypothetical protein